MASAAASASPPDAQPADLLGQLVHLATEVVALRREVALLAVELEGGVELVQQLGLRPPGHGRPHPGRVRPEAANVDHGRRGYWRRLGGPLVNRPRAASTGATGCGARLGRNRVAGSLRYTITEPMAATTAPTSVAVFMPLV